MRGLARAFLRTMQCMGRRVVITGVGAATGFGVGVEALWSGLHEGRSAIGPIERFDATGFDSRLGAEIKGLAAKDYVPKSYRKHVKIMARDTEIAVAAAMAATADAALVTRAAAESAATTYPPSRTGCNIGAGFIAAETDELTEALITACDGDPVRHGAFDLRKWGGLSDELGGGMGNLQPLWMLKYLPNMLACHVTILHGAEGPSNTITCGESSGVLSIGESMRVIQRGDADVCFAGGCESKLNLLGMAKWTLARRLAPTGDASEGWRLVRPYDPEATGTLMGEGGAILIIEEAHSAAERGAKGYAEIVGFGAAQSVLTWDGDEIDGLSAGERIPGEGLSLAIEAALREAQIGPEDVDVIVPQALGVATVDAAEAAALSRVFGERLAEIPLVTITPGVGDTVAGHGALQAATAALCIRHRTLPARLHAGSPRHDLRAESAQPTPLPIRHVLLCTGSLAGQNAAMVLRTC